MRVGDERSSSPFRLYQAAVEDSAQYAGPGDCACCGTVTDGRLTLGVGAYVIYRCTMCEQSFPVRVEGHDRRVRTCPHCGMVNDGHCSGGTSGICAGSTLRRPGGKMYVATVGALGHATGMRSLPTVCEAEAPPLRASR